MKKEKKVIHNQREIHIPDPQMIYMLELIDKDFEMTIKICYRKQKKMENLIKRWRISTDKYNLKNFPSRYYGSENKNSI